jgi:hypothetical protein
METAGLLLVLAAIGGAIVVRTIWADTSRTGEAVVAGAPEAAVAPEPEVRRKRGRRQLLTATALSDALAVDTPPGGRQSFFRRTLAFGRLLLVILFICALAGGAIVLVATTLARAFHSQSG